MTIKSSGSQLSFTEIEAEFGETDNRGLGQYRANDPSGAYENRDCGQLGPLPLDVGIPLDGEIKFSDFYGKRLNMVIDYYSGGEQTAQNDGANTMAATYRYLNETTEVKVVGNFKTRPGGSINQYQLTSNAWQGGKRVIIHVNKHLGSRRATVAANNSGNNDPHRKRCALRTGGWPSGTQLQIDIGSGGRIQGAGGNGRKGVSNNGDAARALSGTSGLGIEYPAQINNSGIIRCGYGGGGGGAGANSDPNKNPRDFGRSGGGGGGGAGIPFGLGGAENAGGYGNCGKGNDLSDQGGKGKAGDNGTKNQGGDRGLGGNHGEGGGRAGHGGIGGDINDPAAGGGARSGGSGGGQGSLPGQRGFGMIFKSTAIRNASSGTKDVPANQGDHAITDVES